MEEFFVPKRLSLRKAEQVRERLCFFVLPLRDLEQQGLRQLDLVICSRSGVRQLEAALPKVYSWSREDPHAVVRAILKDRRDLALPLARNFLPFRRLVCRRSIRSVSLENALFAMALSAADAMPALFSLLRSVAGINSSSLFLTANQIRLAFLIAAANDSEVGFREQSEQITAIAFAGLKWRSLARDLEGRSSRVNSLLAKGLLAFVATYVTGLALEQLHRLGRGMTREEKSDAHEEAYHVGRRALDGILTIAAARP
jgi:hypothetical protein